MTRFIYTAEKKDGEVYKNSADVADRFEIYSLIRREGGRLISISEDASSNVWNVEYWSAKLSSVSEYEKILFARNLGAMLAAGLALSRALAVIERQTKNQKLVSLVNNISNGIRQGGTFHDSLQHSGSAFSDVFIAMVRAGEEGGNLSETLLLVADQMERVHNLKKKIQSALIYPSIIVFAILIIGAFMMVEVVPSLAQTFSELKATLPLSTRVVLGLSDFLVRYTFVAVASLGSVVAGLYIGMRTATGKRVRDFAVLHTPLIGTLTREVNAARTARTLASLLSAGVDVVSALDITKDVLQNSYFREVIEAAKKQVVAGEPFSEAFIKREDLYPAFVGEMMAVGAETGTVNDMLKRLAVFYEDEVDRKTKDMSTIIEPFLMLFIGVAVGFFAISMISPIYQISQNI